MDDKPFDITEALNDMDGGAFMQRVSKAVADTAFATVSQDDSRPRKGKVTVTFDMDLIANSRQLNINHDVKFEYPTKAGKRSENHTTATPMHVGHRGHISLFPETQTDMFKSQTEDA